MTQGVDRSPTNRGYVAGSDAARAGVAHARGVGDFASRASGRQHRSPEIGAPWSPKVQLGVRGTVLKRTFSARTAANDRPLPEADHGPEATLGGRLQSQIAGNAVSPSAELASLATCPKGRFGRGRADARSMITKNQGDTRKKCGLGTLKNGGYILN